MRMVKYGIKNCGECIHLSYKEDIDYERNQYYCEMSKQFINHIIDIRKSIPDMCMLEKC